MADDNIIKTNRFKMTDETSSYFAPSSVGDVSTTLYDDFFTDCLNMSTTLGLHITCKTLGSNDGGGVEDLRLTPYSHKLRFIQN